VFAKSLVRQDDEAGSIGAGYLDCVSEIWLVLTRIFVVEDPAGSGRFT